MVFTIDFCISTTSLAIWFKSGLDPLGWKGCRPTWSGGIPENKESCAKRKRRICSAIWSTTATSCRWDWYEVGDPRTTRRAFVAQLQPMAEFCHRARSRLVFWKRGSFSIPRESGQFLYMACGLKVADFIALGSAAQRNTMVYHSSKRAGQIQRSLIVYYLLWLITEREVQILENVYITNRHGTSVPMNTRWSVQVKPKSVGRERWKCVCSLQFISLQNGLATLVTRKNTSPENRIQKEWSAVWKMAEVLNGHSWYAARYLVATANWKPCFNVPSKDRFAQGTFC